MSDTNGNAVLAQTNGQTVASELSTITKPKRVRTHQRDQAARLQAFAYESAMALKRSCVNADTGELTMDAATAVCVHKLIGAWDTAADRLRILRGKGLPASIKPASPRRAAEIKPLNDA